MNKAENEAPEFEGEDSLSENTCIYPDANIRITKDQFTVFELIRRIEKNTLILNPNYQRNYVWNNKQTSLLIESVLMGIPIPMIYLFEDDDGVRQVVDGRQRITTFLCFLRNEFKLKHLSVLANFNGKNFNELSLKMQAKIEDYQINTYIIQPPTPEQVKFDIFHRVNQGGTQLNNQEMRHALYYGPITQLIERLAKSEAFLTATEKTLSPKRMKDQYLILRYLAFYLLRKGELGDIEFKSDIDDFLAKAMRYINRQIPEHRLKSLEDMFLLAMENCAAILGVDAFRFQSDGQRRPINMGLFEMIAYLFSVPVSEYAGIEKLKNIINNEKLSIDLTGDGFSGRIDTITVVNERFSKAEKLQQEHILCLDL